MLIYIWPDFNSIIRFIVKTTGKQLSKSHQRLYVFQLAHLGAVSVISKDITLKRRERDVRHNG